MKPEHVEQHDKFDPPQVNLDGESVKSNGEFEQGHYTVDQLIHLQRIVGKRAIQRLMHSAKKANRSVSEHLTLMAVNHHENEAKLSS